ncbi:MAG TPA: rhodanese-like domain-containing protein [Acidobacteriaceae bacterium]|nr:rhodanese-like domain-containing protein [Acidobacteriaceae bacterium]
MNQLSRAFLRHSFAALLAGLVATAALHAQSAATIPAGVLVEPQAFHQELQAHPHAVVVLQVGSRLLFDEGHIPGAEYAGPASSEAGLAVLRTRVEKLARTKAIVLYCGCCPWGHCPNVAPAWDLLHQMGFTHVRVLHLADNFGTDWVALGYGAERGQ